MAGYPEVAAKIDAFFARVEARHGADMRCQSGCSDCCQPGLSVTRVEAEAIRALDLTGFTIDTADRCAALDAQGRCKIYAARPFVCRSHGAPIRIAQVIRNCHHNAAVVPDPDCVLDQTTLSALSLAVNGGDTERFDLRDLLLDCAAHGHPAEPSEVQVRR